MSDAQPSPVKRIGFSLPFFKKKGDKPISAEKLEAAKRKALIDEGHRYLSETTELVHENRDHPYMRANGYFTIFQERWSELYGMAPSAKKAKKGKMMPEEFRDHSRDLLDDVHSVLQNGKIEPRGSPSSQGHQNNVQHEPVHEAPVTLERSKSVARQPSHRRKESRDEERLHHSDPERSGSVRHRDRDDSEPRSSSRKNSTRHHRGETEDDRHRAVVEPIPEEDVERYYESKSRRHRNEVPMDRKANESSKYSSDTGRDDESRRRRREERRREEGYRDDRPREDRHRDGRYKEDRYRDDRYRDERYRDDRYKDDPYRYDSYRRDRHQDDRYRDDRYRDDRYRDDKYYDDRHRSSRRRGDRDYDDKYRDDRYRDDKYRDDKYRDDKYRDSRRRDDRRRDEPHRDERRREKHRDDGAGGEGEEHYEEQEHSNHDQDDTPKHIPPPGSPPVAMSPTYIPYPREDEPRHRGGSRRHSREDGRRHRRGEPSASRNHSPHMGNDSEHPPMSPDPDLERTSPYMGDPAL